ncbi:MAG TPA: hypothetical protein VIK55_21180 [Paludibacter sp.]
MEQSHLNKIFYFLLVGIILVIISPFLFTRGWTGISFKDTGTIGDTIGGITAPLTSLIGSILVYFALKAQIDANKLIQDQFDQQKKDEIEQKKLTYISEQINIVRSDLNDFTFSYKDDNNNCNYTGADAIFEYLKKIKHRGNHDEDVFATNPKIVELYNIFQVFDKLVTLISTEKLPEQDRVYFISILEYIMNSKFKTSFTALAEYKMSLQPPCKNCGKRHTGIPDELFDLVESISNKFKAK